MRETIQRVMAAEDEAKRLVEAARRQGDALLSNCRRRAQQLADGTEREARLEGEGILQAASGAALREREERIRSAFAAIEATIRLDEAVAGQTVEAIVRCVCGRGQS